MKVPVEVDAEVLEKAMEASGARNPEDLVQVALQRVSFNKWMKDTFDWPEAPPTPEELRAAYAPYLEPEAPDAWQAHEFSARS